MVTQKIVTTIFQYRMSFSYTLCLIQDSEFCATRFVPNYVNVTTWKMAQMKKICFWRKWNMHFSKIGANAIRPRVDTLLLKDMKIIVQCDSFIWMSFRRKNTYLWSGSFPWFIQNVLRSLSFTTIKKVKIINWILILFTENDNRLLFIQTCSYIYYKQHMIISFLTIYGFVFFRFTDSDYLFDLRILITPLVSSNSSSGVAG